MTDATQDGASAGGWSPERYERWFADTASAQLLVQP